MQLKTYDKNVDFFINTVIPFELNYRGIDFTISNLDYVLMNGTKCNGFFNEFPVRELAVAVGKPMEQWLPTLVHEYCHYLQFKERSPFWMDLHKNGVQEEDKVFEWAEGKEYDWELIKTLTHKTKMMEFDCEKRVCDIAKQFNLPIDIENYAKKANAYVLFYNVIPITRKWYDIGKEPYNDPKFLEMVPNHFNYNPDEMSIELTNAYLELVGVKGMEPFPSDMKLFDETP